MREKHTSPWYSKIVQFEAIQKLLDSYDIGEWICGICFDTTASNTGRLRGACTRLAHFHDQLSLLMLACRHHVGEVHISHFNSKVAGNRTVGPENQLFKSLKIKWPEVGADQVDTLSRFDYNGISGGWLGRQATLALDVCKSLKNKNILRNDKINLKRFCKI